MICSTRRFVVCLTMCHFVLVFFSPFSIAITSLGEERANLSAFRTFVRFVLVWICRFPLPLGVWEGLRFVIVALPRLFSYLFFLIYLNMLHYSAVLFVLPLVPFGTFMYLRNLVVCPSSRISFPDDSLSKHQWIFTKLVYALNKQYFKS